MEAMVKFFPMIFCFTVPVCRKDMESSKLNSIVAELPGMNYPFSVERFYKANKFKPIWVGTHTSNNRAWAAILLLQYGLLHAGYHPEQLSQSKIRWFFSNRNDIDSAERTAFDVYLTDAMITLINAPRFGKAMERAKWYVPTLGDYIEINLPLFLLTYHGKDTIYTFKVTIEKKDRPTSAPESSLTYLNTAPGWKVPKGMLKSQIVPQAYSTKKPVGVTCNLGKCSIAT